MLRLTLFLAFVGLSSTQLHPHLLPPALETPHHQSHLIHPDQTRAILHTNRQQQRPQRNNFRVSQTGFQHFVHNNIHDLGQANIHDGVQNGFTAGLHNGFQNGFQSGAQNDFKNGVQNNLNQKVLDGHQTGGRKAANELQFTPLTLSSVRSTVHTEVQNVTQVHNQDTNGHKKGVHAEIQTSMSSASSSERSNQTSTPEPVQNKDASPVIDQTASSTKQSSSSTLKQASREKGTKNHALFYRSATGSTNKHHRDSTKVQIPANKTVEEILQWLQSRYKAVNLRKAREDLSRVYLPSELSSTLEPRPFQTQKYSSPLSTTPASPQINSNQRQSTPTQKNVALTTDYNEQTKNYNAPTSQTEGRIGQAQTGYQQPFLRTQTSFAKGQETPSVTYNAQQSAFQTSTQQSYQPQTQQSYQPQTQQSYQPQTQQSYQPQTQQSYQGYQAQTQQSYQPQTYLTQQGYQPNQQGYQPGQPQPSDNYQTPTGYQLSTEQEYQQSYQPSSSPQPSYQSTFQSVSTTFSQPAPSQPNSSGTLLVQSNIPSEPTSSNPLGSGNYNQAVGGSEGQGAGYPQSLKPSSDDGLNYQEPANTIQPPPYTSEGDIQQIYSNTYSQQGSSSPSSIGPQSDLTSVGYQPEDGQLDGGNGNTQQQVGQHPPHIHDLKVVCSKEAMIVNVEFNELFNGVIYSKGHHNEEECRYVLPNSASNKYSFTLKLNSCGTQYIEDFASGKPAYLENTLVIQNEPGILEIWDYIRNVRCLWEGSITQSLSSGLSIDGLNQEVVTFSGDTAKAKLELQAGRGPFSNENVNLVRIGDLMTLVVSVEGDNGFNIRVGECIASDGQPNTFNRVTLTDDRGCTVKEKVMGGFQFIRHPTTGASIAYAFFRAFKFPDVMELAIECSVQLCKTECAPCPDPNQLIEPRRRRRWIQNVTEEIFEELRLKNKIQVFLPEELSANWPQAVLNNAENNDICVTPHIFYSSWAAMLFVTLVSTFGWVYFWYKAAAFTKKYFK